MNLSAGSLVRHATLGQGKVVAVDSTALHVFFPGSDGRYASKLRRPAAERFLSQEGLTPDPWLEGLTAFSLDSASSRYALAANFVSEDEAVALYVAEYPGGAPVGRAGSRAGRATRWRAAGAEWSAAMGAGRAAELRDDGAYDELGRRALRVASVGANVRRMPEPDVLAEAFAPGAEVHHFLDALLSFLSAPLPSRPRFDRLCVAVGELGVPSDAAWPLVTFFPFVAAPDRHVLLLPSSTCAAASALGWNLQYRPAPNWNTYARLREHALRLLEKLAPGGARDLVDVEHFLHATGSRRAEGTGRASGTRRKTRKDP